MFARKVGAEPPAESPAEAAVEPAQGGVQYKPTYCYQCVAGPDFLQVKVEDGVATQIEPNHDAAAVHPGGGKVCVKAYGLIQKSDNPNRITRPMKRTNPKKGRDEDPGFVAISWDEAFEMITARLNRIREAGLLDGSGYPKVAVSFGGGGTPQSYMGTLPAFLSAWGPIDFGFGSGQGVKCVHSEHLYGELWHRAFTVSADTPTTEYLINCGSNVEASGGVVGVARHADARARGMTRVQVEPHLSITGACSAEWLPIKPKTDPAFLFALLHVMVHESERARLDLPFLRHDTSAPYLVAPNGYYLRDPATEKPLIWDTVRAAAVPFDDPAAEPALEGRHDLDGLEIGPDDERWQHKGVPARTAFDALVDHLAPYSPEWAAEICDIPAAKIREVANAFLDHAHIGETIDIDGEEMPYRPVAITLGKTVNNGWGGFECCWARTLAACLVGALEVPGGTLGTTVRLNKPNTDRHESVRPDPDGFMAFPFNPTGKESWHSRPNIRNAYQTLVPLASDGPWSQALGPTHFSWMFLDGTPEGLPEVTFPEVWFFYRTNPAISFWDTNAVTERISRFPFVVAFAYTHDESNHMADVLLPDRVDLEGLQLIPIGGTKFSEQFWEHRGYALRQPVATAPGETRDMTDIATELARRTGLLKEYNEAINRGAACLPLRTNRYDFALDPECAHGHEEIWDAVCRAASATVTDGAASDGLDWFKRHGFRVAPDSRRNWYLYPTLKRQGLRFELPYQERLKRIGAELANRLHERGIDWWEQQLAEYQALPVWKDFPGMFEQAATIDGANAGDYPFWLLTSRSMQYAWGGNAGIQLMKEVASNIAGHGGVIINTEKAAELGLAEGDLVEVRSPTGKTQGQVVLRHGIRPDTLLMIGQFDHWATPFAKDFHVPSMNSLTPMSMALTDATGSGADIVKVGIHRLAGAAQ